MKAVIVGATGLVGSLLVRNLVNDSRLNEVISISRRTLEIRSDKLKQVIIPDLLQTRTVAESLRGDFYFCCLGTTIKDAGSQENFRKVDFDAIVEFGRLAEAHHAKSFVVISAMGANARSSVFYNRVKGEAENALTKLKLQSLTIFRPGLLIGNRAKPRTGEQFAEFVLKGFSFILPKRVEKMVATNAEHLASRMLELGMSAQPGTRTVSAGEI